MSERTCVLCGEKEISKFLIELSPVQDEDNIGWKIEWMNNQSVHFRCAYQLFDAVRRIEGKSEIVQLEAKIDAQCEAYEFVRESLDMGECIYISSLDEMIDWMEKRETHKTT